MAGKYDAVDRIKAENPGISWSDAASQAGFSGRWTSSKGKAKPRTGNKVAQEQKRSQFDQPSTELAGYESRKLKKEVTRINQQAKMFGLTPTQIEHLADQDDIKALISGSGGDPDNKLIVDQDAARAKNHIKQILKDDYAVTINTVEESIKAIPKRFYDPIADPSTLPGIDIKVEEYQDFDFSGGGARLKKFFKNVGRFNAAAKVVAPVAIGAAFLSGGPAEAAVTAVETLTPLGDVMAPQSGAETGSMAEGNRIMKQAAANYGPQRRTRTGSDTQQEMRKRMRRLRQR